MWFLTKLSDLGNNSQLTPQRHTLWKVNNIEKRQRLIVCTLEGTQYQNRIMNRPLCSENLMK